jgi:hypothetical protein
MPLFVLDVIATVSLTAALAIGAGFAGTFYLGPWLVSATSVRHPLTIAAVAMVLRSAYTGTPFLGFVPVATLPRRALAIWRRLDDMLASLALQRAQQALVVVMAASLAVKLMLAYRHPGFWTGDDVEIHEMTFARLFARDWPLSHLRSPVYPLGIIYPVQALVVKAGQRDPAWLVFAGRAVVAAFSIATLWLAFRVTRRLYGSIPVALLCALILATNKLQTMTGTTELPRPVSSFFVLAAFWLLSVFPRDVLACVAGGLVGLAASMRFSEEIFVLPALAQLIAGRRWRGVLMFGLGFAAVAAVAVGVIDARYWGEPFFSLRQIVDFTLTRRLSTRGFQPWYEYLRAIPSWTNIGIAALAIYATVRLRLWIPAAWTWLPLVALSVLPHKEPRYLVPILPYFSMLAAAGLWQAIVWLRQTVTCSRDEGRERAALVLTASVVAMLVTEPAAYVLPRTDDGVRIARYIAAHTPTGGVLSAPAWNIGGRLYLQHAHPFLDIDPARMNDRALIEAAIRTPGVVWLVMQERDIRTLGHEPLIHAAGFEQIAVPGLSGSSYRLYRRRAGGGG